MSSNVKTEEAFVSGLRILQGNVCSGETDGNASLSAIRAPLNQDRRESAIHRIELVVIRLLRQLVNLEEPELLIPEVTEWHYTGNPLSEPPLTQRPGDSPIPGYETNGSSSTGLPSTCKFCRVRFDAPQSQRKFSIITMLLAHVHKLLSTRSSGTRRQLYYEEVSYLRCQREVDSGALSVGRVVGLPPWQLGLLATAKGLVAGDLTITTADGQVLDCRSKPGGVLIPGDVSTIESVSSSARFILVLEKDTIFQRVLRDGVLQHLGPCILVTRVILSAQGKGYPDVSTRVLLARLEAELKLPMLAVMDADPHGVHIMCVYRFGTKTCPLPLRSMRWLGVLPSEVVVLGVRAVPLTAKDVSLARSLLDKYDLTPALRTEVRTLLSQGLKAEVDALIEFSPSYISQVYLHNKISAANVI